MVISIPNCALIPPAALLVERADLAVEDGVRRPQPALDRAGRLRKTAREVVAVPARQRDLAARDGDDRPEAVPLRLVYPVVASRKRVRGRREHRRVAQRSGVRAVLAQKQPVLLVPIEPRRDERPDPVQALAVQANGQPAVPLLLEQLVRAAVPDLDGARAVLARRDRPLEVAVLERVVLDVDREVALPTTEWDAFRHGPARERAVPLEAEVVVEATRIVPLHDEARLVAAGGTLAERLGRLPGTPLAAVLVESHVPVDCRLKRNGIFTNCTQI